ncbi:AmmeMemoRadiSam system radical SAM enzyme [Mycoplasmatota bacterium]|nr:AmmeMemoRadiSam system radical SAM enzyme [Mycoplasmatota bacterium]
MFSSVENNKIRCQLCPQFCLISEGQLGLCQTRKNIDQQLFAINYGETTSIALDPIEKKPLYHFKPGSKILSIGTFGCNMKCSFCQNYQISQIRAKSDYIKCDELLRLVDTVENNIGIAFTYNEPFMWYEYIYDMALNMKAKENDKSIVMVTNGYINPKPLEKLLPFIDALNIDLKAFDSRFYREICKADLEPVLKTIEIAQKYCHVEVTTLMVTEKNDSIEEIEMIAKYIGKINKNIPLHLTRYYPNYKMNQQPTKLTKMFEAKEIAQEYLNYVYLGNIPNEDQNTYCPNCHKLVLDRRQLKKSILDGNKCLHCGEIIPIVL